jgi:hypothetical protein
MTCIEKDEISLISAVKVLTKNGSLKRRSPMMAYIK